MICYILNKFWKIFRCFARLKEKLWPIFCILKLPSFFRCSKKGKNFGYRRFLSMRGFTAQAFVLITLKVKLTSQTLEIFTNLLVLETITLYKNYWITTFFVKSLRFSSLRLVGSVIYRLFHLFFFKYNLQTFCTHQNQHQRAFHEILFFADYEIDIRRSTLITWDVKGGESIWISPDRIMWEREEVSVNIP